MRFRGFLDIKSVYDILDEKTVWKYKNIFGRSRYLGQVIYPIQRALGYLWTNSQGRKDN